MSHRLDIVNKSASDLRDAQKGRWSNPFLASWVRRDGQGGIGVGAGRLQQLTSQSFSGHLDQLGSQQLDVFGMGEQMQRQLAAGA